MNGNGKYKRASQHGDKSKDGKLVFMKPGLENFSEYADDFRQARGTEPKLDKHGGFWFWAGGEAARPKYYRTKPLQAAE